MASVGSLSSSTSNSIRGYGGLASGLDRDELIKGMTLGTTSKLNQQEQKKQKIEWMQEAVRAISDKMISFHGKYTETLTSSTNLFSSMLWGRNKITTSGDNSKYVSISGTASGADAMTIMGIKQKAQNASWSSASGVSNGALSGEGVNKADTYNLEGTELHLKVGEGLYTINLKAESEENLDDIDKVVAAVNKALENETYKQDTGKKLSEFIEAKKSDDGKFVLVATDTIPEGVDAKLLEGSAMRYLGLDGKGESDLKADGGVSGEVQDLKTTFGQKLSGKTLTFSYNGTSKSINILTDELEKKYADEGESALANEKIRESLQNQLDAAFGKGRISVEEQNGELTFKTMIPGGGEDKSATLTLVGGDDAAMKALGLKRGESTRLDLDVEIGKSGLKNDNKITFTNGKASLKINNETIEINETDSLRKVMQKITEKTGLQVSYMEASDKFTFTSNEKGESGAISLDETSRKLFGLTTEGTSETSTGIFEKRGQDAIVSVKYAGSDEVVNLRRDSNTFTVDGLTIALKGTFGEYDKTTGELKDKTNIANAVEINASVDVDKLMNTIKSFVEEYNSIVDMVNGELTTKHDRDYDPLTSEQKGELSENEISKWEAKAKEGLLYGDSDLRSLSMDLRVVVSGGLLVEFEKVGINLSSSYSDNGKLSIDESKLRAALETDPESVEKLFTSKAGVGADGKETFNGLATNLKSVMDKYVKTIGSMDTKGILIRKAGSKSAAQSLTQNTYYDQLTALDKLINQLKTRLKTEQDRYISQFSTLETMIANMNSQSSYLSSMGGY